MYAIRSYYAPEAIMKLKTVIALFASIFVASLCRANSKEIDHCTIITKTEVEAYFGREVKPPRLKRTTGSNGLAGASCLQPLPPKAILGIC